MKVFIIAAISADGLMGMNADQRSLDWRSREDAQFFIEATKAARVMVMGSATYKTFKMKRAPPGRRLIVYTHNLSSISGEGVETTSEEPAVLIRRLALEGYTEIAICGGAAIHSMFLAAGLVDEVYLTIEPVLFGQGIPFTREPLRVPLKLLDTTNLNASTVLLHYAIEK